MVGALALSPTYSLCGLGKITSSLVVSISRFLSSGKQDAYVGHTVIKRIVMLTAALISTHSTCLLPTSSLPLNFFQCVSCIGWKNHLTSEVSSNSEVPDKAPTVTRAYGRRSDILEGVSRLCLCTVWYGVLVPSVHERRNTWTGKKIQDAT